jgi:hypothetical protein
LKQASFVSRVADSIKPVIAEQVVNFMAKGLSEKEAKMRVADSIAKVGFFDPKIGKYVAEPIIKRLNDSMLAGMSTPIWNVSQIQKVYKQPFLRGYADHLVTKVGVPNVWADLIQIFTASYEGMARVANVARAMPQFNTTVGFNSRTGTMLSEVINLVIDYESPDPSEQIIGGMPGNWLTNTAIGERDAYANLMLEILMNSLIYFGHEESGFEGLTQIANRDDTYTEYPDDRPPASYLWDHDGAGPGTPVNMTVGADLLLMLNHFIADKMEELHFLPTECRVTCGSTLYKALKFTMLSKEFNQNNPLSIINNAFEAGNKIEASLIKDRTDSLNRSFTLKPDPMLDPNTPFNPLDEDLLFITFPTLQSELEVDSNLTDLVMMPTPIDKMVLPSAPGYRDGVVRTSLKRIGSLLCPIRKTVHVIHGMGTNSRYTP